MGHRVSKCELKTRIAPAGAIENCMHTSCVRRLAFASRTREPPPRAHTEKDIEETRLEQNALGLIEQLKKGKIIKRATH
jgi:hypothetical protein